MVSIRNLDVCEVASDRNRIQGGCSTIVEKSSAIVDTDPALFVSAFSLTDGFSIASASSATATISSSGGSSSFSISSAAL